MDEKEFFDHYSGLKASEDGDVMKNGKIIIGILGKNGYMRVSYRSKHYYVHILVAEVFLNGNKPLPEGYVVHHINENPEDNRVENLLILSHKEHTALHHKGKVLTDETKRKMSEAKKGLYLGSNSPLAIPVIGTNIKTGEVREFLCASEAERILKIGHHILECCNGKRQSAGGWRWEYKV